MAGLLILGLRIAGKQPDISKILEGDIEEILEGEGDQSGFSSAHPQVGAYLLASALYR